MLVVAELLIEAPVGAAVIAGLTARRAALGMSNVGVSARVEDAPHLRVAESGGSGERDLVMFSQQLTFEAFGKTLTASSDIMRRSMAGMREMQHSVVSVTVEGVTYAVTFYGLRSLGAGLNSEDPVTKRVRYTRSIVVDTRLQLLS